jgi:AraC-like DNA-binding protein
MIENFNILFLLGGYSECDQQWWNRNASEADQCFKLYFPIEGHGKIKIRGKWEALLPDHIYFISGYELEAQQCDQLLNTYWVHFKPASILLTYLLKNTTPFISWEKSFNCFGDDCGGIFEAIFKKSSQVASEKVAEFHITARTSQTENFYSQLCQAQSLVLYFISDIIKNTNVLEKMEDNLTVQRLKQSIDFMNSHLMTMPPLEKIAEKSHLSPNYFHRLFTRIFGITPYHYMIQQRMETAKQLLSTTGMTIKEIAGNTGFDNEFYFSRVFKKQMGLNPSEYRKRRWVP